MAICRRYSKDRMEAEDMLQIGFVKVFEKIDQLKDKSLENWMKKIFINTCLTQWQKNKSSLIVLVESPIETNTNEADGLQKLQAKDLFELIELLPVGAKVIFNLFAVEGYQHGEIASMLNISESASRAQLSRARLLLKERLRKHI